MIVSEHWLREYVNPSVDTAELVEKMTMLGLEVDGIEPAAPLFSGVVVGEIIEITPHPDADKLRVCQVQGSVAPVQVVCGAKNASKGLKIPFAEVGAKLPNDFKIKKAKLRGVESFGMLCAASELGLAEQSSGLWELPIDAPVGVSLRDYLNFDDALIDVDLTPNRGDCLSIQGIAREIATAYSIPMVQPAVVEQTVTSKGEKTVNIHAGTHCSRYVGRVIEGVDMSVETPLWMVERLRRAGIRSLNAVVDITNYVMLELGQPMHAFDLEKIEGDIHVRFANKDERITLLDESEVTLLPDTLVIADDDKALAMAGIMGGLDSAVTSKTKNVFLESAFFAPEKIIGKARAYGLHTDSSHRFERGVDYEGQQKAIERATELMIDIVGGKVGVISHVESADHLPEMPTINLRKERIERVLGISLDGQVIEENLTALGMQITSQADGWLVQPPSYRFDICIESDLIEEVLRLYGYDQIPYTQYQGNGAAQIKSEKSVDIQHYKQILVDRGYQEAICYSFISPEWQAVFDENAVAISLSNPISSDLSVMRTSLIPGLLNAVQHNLNRQQKRVRLFESGLRFVPKGNDLLQEHVISGVICGDMHSPIWNADKRNVDFFDVKGDIEALLCSVGLDGFEFKPSNHSALHPGQSADIYKDGQKIGMLGALHPRINKKMKLKEQPFVFELLSSSIQSIELPKAKPLSEFPATRRDLALLVDKSVSSADVVNCIKSASSSKLQSIVIFDVYEGDNLKENLKSIALGLILQDFSSTLDDQEVDEIIQKVLKTLKKELNAVLRD